MPELPEVETVRNTLRPRLMNQTITNVQVYYPNLIVAPNLDTFQKRILNQQIHEIERRGKWLIFILDNDILLSHLRMEGKYLFRNPREELEKHVHITFSLSDGTELRYHDTRKFGRMYLLAKEVAYLVKPLSELGLEPWDEALTISYLKEKLRVKKIPIKTALLDQSIITGIGNIYADEILFMSHIHPLKKSSLVTKNELDAIICNTRKILSMAIDSGGTTIRSYSSSEGVHGKFQHELHIHGQKECPVCHTSVDKIRVGGRGTYFCPVCQKKK